MNLRTRLILLTTAVVTILFGISEWLSYEQTATLLDQHEAILIETADHAVALEKLRATRERMFLSATTMRVLHAVGTLLIAVAILNYVWFRVVYSPIRRLLSQINIMARGTWKSSLPVERNDEIGELTKAFNDLGQQLTSSFESINASSRLSALALVGGRLKREVATLHNQTIAARRGLDTRTDAGAKAAGLILASMQAQLETWESRFEKDFEDQFSAVSAEHGPAAGRARAKAFAASSAHHRSGAGPAVTL